MKRHLETEADDPSQSATKKTKTEASAATTRQVLGSLRMQTGLDLSKGFDFLNQIPPDELEATLGGEVEAPNIPRLLKSGLVNSDMVWRPNAPQDVDKYLDLARGLTNVPEKLQEVQDIVDTQNQCETIMLDIQAKALRVRSDNDLLELEEHIRSELSSPEAQLDIMRDSLDDFETELSVSLAEMGLLEAGEDDEDDEEEDEEEDEEYDEEEDEEEEEDIEMEIADMKTGTDDDRKETTVERVLRCLGIPESAEQVDGKQNLEDPELDDDAEEYSASGDRETPYEAVLYQLGSFGDGGPAGEMDPDGEDDEEIIGDCLSHAGLFGL
jgi:hypothetical protein